MMSAYFFYTVEQCKTTAPRFERTQLIKVRKWCSELTCLTSQRQKGQGSTHLTSPNHINPFDYIQHRGLLSCISLLSPRGLCTVKERNTFSCDPNTPTESINKKSGSMSDFHLPSPPSPLSVSPSPCSPITSEHTNKKNPQWTNAVYFRARKVNVICIPTPFQRHWAKTAVIF